MIDESIHRKIFIQLLTNGGGHNDLRILQLKVVVQLAVSSQLAAANAERTELGLPVGTALTAQCLHRGHCTAQQQVRENTRVFYSHEA